MHTYSAPRARVVMVLLALVTLLASGATAQDSLDGAWELTAYDGRASVGKASGLLTFASGRFSLVYTMEEPDGRTSGRAHAGRFRRDGETLTLDVDWTMQYVDGKGQAQRGGNARRTIKLSRANDRLTLTYDNGSVQDFQRVTAPAVK